MQIQGTIHTKPYLQTSQATGNSWVEIVVYSKEEFRGNDYIDYFPVRFFKEKAESIVQEIRQGDLVMVNANLSGQENEYEDKMTHEKKVRYQLSLMGQAIEIYNRSDSKYSKVKGAVATPQVTQPTTDTDGEPLPF